MAMSSDTTVVQAIQIEFATPGVDQSVEQRVEPAVELPLCAKDTERTGLDDQWIETQLARADRWRRPSLPLVCEVAQRYRERQVRPLTSQIDVDTAAEAEDSAGQSETAHTLPWGALVWSILLHAAVVATLAVWAMPDAADGEQNVLTVTGTSHRTDTLASPPRLLEISVASAAANPITAPHPSDCPVPPPPDVSLVTFVQDHSGPVVDVHSLLSHRSDATERSGDGPSGAEFFGVQASGDRFVFLIDCSVTMSVGTKWMEVMRQLTTAVEALGEDQWFYVIFFSEESQRMFNTNAPEPHCLPATPQNVERLRRWLLTIKTGMSTQPAKSVKFALTLEPDAIYLLSDGEYDRHDPTLDLLSREQLNRAKDNKRQVVVHTLSFLNSNLAARDKKKLQDIARQNGGRYVCVTQGPRATTDQRD